MLLEIYIFLFHDICNANLLPQEGTVVFSYSPTTNATTAKSTEMTHGDSLLDISGDSRRIPGEHTWGQEPKVV